MDFIKARTIAEKICRTLQPHTLNINIAGSIRRERHEVKDIEIVCLPVLHTNEQEHADLFGVTTRNQFITVDAGFTAAVHGLGTIRKGRVTGRYMQIVLPEDIVLDLFMPQADDYYRQYAIRTGSATFAHKMLAARWVKQGWVGTDDGLRLQSQCVDYRGTWKCTHPNPTLPPTWQSERQFFEFVGVPYQDPKDRNW